MDVSAAIAVAAAVTARDSRIARPMSAGPGDRPSPSHGRRWVTPAYRFEPPSRTPSAPANAASQRPAFGLGCCPPYLRKARQAAAGLPPATGAQATASSPVSRAGPQLATSSSRAGAQPNLAYRPDRYPTIESSVFTAR